MSCPAHRHPAPLGTAAVRPAVRPGWPATPRGRELRMGKSHHGTWSEDPRDLLRTHPEFELGDLDRDATPGWDAGKKAGKKFGDKRGDLMGELQERLFAEGSAGGERSLLVVVQGLDTAGKGGVARHVMSKVDPQGVALRSFGPPTPEEQEHHFLWRIKKELPPPGLIGVFDRSHYEDVLVARVDELVPPKVWEKRYDEINDFEAGLVESGTTVLKFGLMVSHDEQGQRLMKRLDRPDKHWKYSTNDLPTRLQWDDYQDAYADVFRSTSTDVAPWYVIPADHKWYARLAITEILVQTLVDMDPEWPTVRWDPEVQRRRACGDPEHQGAARLAQGDRPPGQEGRRGRPRGPGEGGARQQGRRGGRPAGPGRGRGPQGRGRGDGSVVDARPATHADAESPAPCGAGRLTQLPSRHASLGPRPQHPGPRRRRPVRRAHRRPRLRGPVGGGPRRPRGGVRPRRHRRHDRRSSPQRSTPSPASASSRRRHRSPRRHSAAPTTSPARWPPGSAPTRRTRSSTWPAARPRSGS